MSSGLWARAAVVCVLVALAGSARADERRMVAVIDLSAQPEAKTLRDQLYAALINHWALQPLKTGGLNDALQGDFVDEDSKWLADARDKRVAAEDALARFDFPNALAYAEEGEQLAPAMSPAAAAVVCADLALDGGVAQLAGHDRDEAARRLAFTHRLDPGRALDPVRYSPDILEAYRAAAAAPAPRVQLAVRGTGPVWIDGAARGPAPGTFEVDAGYHLVQIAAPDRITAGQIVLADRDAAVAIEAPVAPLELQVERARKALAALPDDAVARAGAMQQLAQLLGVHDAVLIWKRALDGKLLVQTWRDRAPGFSALREAGGVAASEILAPLAPPRPPQPPPQPRLAASRVLPPAPHHEPEPVWYQRRWVQASVAGGVVLGVIGAILIVNHQAWVMDNTNAQFK